MLKRFVIFILLIINIIDFSNEFDHGTNKYFYKQDNKTAHKILILLNENLMDQNVNNLLTLTFSKYFKENIFTDYFSSKNIFNKTANTLYYNSIQIFGQKLNKTISLNELNNLIEQINGNQMLEFVLIVSDSNIKSMFSLRQFNKPVFIVDNQLYKHVDIKVFICIKKGYKGNTIDPLNLKKKACILCNK